MQRLTRSHPVFGMAIMVAAFATVAAADVAKATATHIYVDQAVGTNSGTTAGTAGDPFKSITYAMLMTASREVADPWVVHVKAGTYDADPDRPDNEEEVFPIALRSGITFQGDDGPENCIISGAFSTDSQAAMLYGEDLDGILVKDLTFSDMARTAGTKNGAACEWVACSGSVTGCVFENNSTDRGAGMWVSIADGGRFDLSGNHFLGNYASLDGAGIYVSGSFTGTVSANTFSANAAYYTGGGLFVQYHLTGDVTDNTFSGNSAGGYYSGSGAAGFFVGNNFAGAVSDNTFSRNAAGNRAGGFLVNGSFNGDVSGNVFSENTSNHWVPDGGAFRIVGEFIGTVNANVFSDNASRAGGGAVAFLDDGGNPDNAVISNNYFLYNSISGDEKLVGNAIYTEQGVAVIHNTFYGGATDESCVNVTNVAADSVIKNNIFANLGSAIWEQSELDPVITGNDFYNVTNILHRNGQARGTDLAFIELLLSNCSGNYEWAPALVGEGLATGTWTDAPVYDAVTNRTILTDGTKSWEPNGWVGTLLDLAVSPTNKSHFLILANGVTKLYVQGNLADTELTLLGDDYAIDDYRLADGSPNIDALASADVGTDFDG